MQTISASKLDDINWTIWQPQDRATLTFIIRDNRILLIRKKRGLGAGKINGPGGRIEAGESPLQCAIRETEEELRVTPVDPEYSGECLFQFTDGYSIHVFVYRASDCIGEPQETNEAIPLWYDIDQIPYQQMWEDDQYWLPLLLNREPFSGQFLFDGDRMLDRKLKYQTVDC